MEQLHAHEVLHMMEGNSYSESSLREAIIKKFGSQQRFYACSAENPSDITEAQIENLRKRLNLTRRMQGLGIASLFFCVVSMFLIYIGLQLFSAYVFGLALILLIASLGVSFREIQISTRSLEIYLGTMEKGKHKK